MYVAEESQCLFAYNRINVRHVYVSTIGDAFNDNNSSIIKGVCNEVPSTCFRGEDGGIIEPSILRLSYKLCMGCKFE